MYAIEINNLDFSYNKEKVLKDISLKINHGEFISIIGPNGSGKTTLLKIINNIYIPESGEIRIYGKDIKDYKARDLAKKIALVPQDTNIEYEISVEDMVLMGRYPYIGRLKREEKEDYDLTYKALNLTYTFHLKDRSINEISGGERQRVIIARALAQNPNIILLDEPTSHLDINHQMEILNILKELNEKQRTTIVLVIHDINLASRFSDNIILLDKGELLDKGKPSEVVNSKNIEKAYNLKALVEKNKITNSIYVIPL